MLACFIRGMYDGCRNTGIRGALLVGCMVWCSGCCLGLSFSFSVEIDW